MSVASRIKAVLLYPLLPEDTTEERQRKLLFMTFYIVIILACSSSAYSVRTAVTTVGSLWMISTTLVAACHLYATRRMSLVAVEYYLYAVCITGFIFDYNTAAGGSERFWPGFVIVIDMLLVCRVRDAVSQAVVMLIVVWLCVTAAESSFRFGLYDIGGTLTAEEQRARVDCSNPPCADVEVGVRNVVMYLCVFLLDFYFTRNFAKMVTTENRRMTSAIRTAQSVAKSLAAFDLDQSRLSLAASPDLPQDLNDALRAIISNLETYKEFLPQSCLPFEAEYDQSAATSQTDLISSVSDRNTSNSDVLSVAYETITHVVKATPVHAPRHSELKRKKITLVTANMQGTLSLRDDPEDLLEKQQHMMSRGVAAVKANRGVVDTFLGDHLFASFNAVRTCAAHSDSAISTSLTFIDALNQLNISANTGIASGRALCGDMGCPGMKRFTILGRVSTWTNIVERVGAEWGVGILCDSTVKSESCLSYPLRLVEQRVLYRKASVSDMPAQLWEVVGDASLHTGISAEWMYEIDITTCWDRYNQALDAWVNGQPDVAITLISESNEDKSPPEVVRARVELVKRIRNGVVPPAPRVVYW